MEINTILRKKKPCPHQVNEYVLWLLTVGIHCSHLRDICMYRGMCNWCQINMKFNQMWPVVAIPTVSNNLCISFRLPTLPPTPTHSPSTFLANNNNCSEHVLVKLLFVHSLTKTIQRKEKHWPLDYGHRPNAPCVGEQQRQQQYRQYEAIKYLFRKWKTLDRLLCGEGSRRRKGDQWGKRKT